MANKLVDKLLSKMSGDDSIKFSTKNPFKKDAVWVHTGSPELEYNLGILGFPVGITEVGGVSKSGKTTIALMAMKHHQMSYPTGLRVILSSEERDNREYAEQIGIDTDDVLIIKSKFIEDLFYKLQIRINQVLEIWKAEKLPGKPKIFVMWDSLGATNSRAELETFAKNTQNYLEHIQKGNKLDMKHAKMGDFASAGKRCMKAMLAQLYELDIVFVILNHVIDDFQTGGKVSTGGSWVQFLPTLRLRTSRTGWEKIDEIEVAQHTKVTVEKNDFGSRKSTMIEILLGYGIILSKTDIEYAAQKGILKKEGEKKYSFSPKLTWNSKRTLYNQYYERNPLLPALHKRIMMERHKDLLAEKEQK
jgi:RecA/RadA recombinase